MFGIDMGPSGQENTQYNNLNASSAFATDTGEKDVSASSDFMRAILSGDQGKISQALAPQISAAKTSAQQQNKTNAEFGTRSGGTAATTANTNDKVHSDITDLIGKLTGSSASGLSSAGNSLLSTGISGDTAAFGEADTMQKQRAAQIDDLISSIGATAGTVAGLPGVSGTKFGKGLNSFGAEFGG